jgi:hypothetical protein
VLAIERRLPNPPSVLKPNAVLNVLVNTSCKNTDHLHTAVWWDQTRVKTTLEDYNIRIDVEQL